MRADTPASRRTACRFASSLGGARSSSRAPTDVCAQMAGATFAGAVNYAIFASGIAAMEASEAIVRGSAASTASFAGAFGMVPNPVVIGPLGAFVAEVWMTGILLFLISALTDTAAGSVPDGAAPALIGGTVGVLIGTFGPVTGCGMNPARDLGPSKHAFAATANAPHRSRSLPRSASLLNSRHADARAPPRRPPWCAAPGLVTLATGWGGAALTSGWVYTLGPLIGGPLGMACYRQLLMPSKKAE